MIKLAPTPEKLNNCPFCGQKALDSDGSLHCWHVEYACGLVLCGAIGDDDVYIDKECKNKNNSMVN